MFISQKVTKTLPSTTTNSLSGNTNINGTGWLPIDFTSSTLGSSIPSLPIDPKNNSSYYYTFMSGENYFELDCILESKTYRDKMTTDGGSRSDLYEVGTSIGLYKLSKLPQSSYIKAYWQFEEASGTIYDQTANNNNGTYNGILYQQTGKIGKCLGFDGDDFVNCGSDDSLHLTNVTIVAWINLDIAPYTYHSIYGHRDNIDKGYLFAVRPTHLDFTTYGVADVQSDAISWTTDQWYHVAVTYDGSNIAFYLNGEAKGTGSASMNAWDTTNVLSIGKAHGGLYFQGRIDEVIIYNKVLTVSEITTLYANGSPTR